MRVFAHNVRRLLLLTGIVALLAAVAPPVAAAFPPLVVTKAATEVGEEVATMNATVNPLTLKTTYWFEYGKTKEYGSKTAEASAGSGLAAVPVSASLKSLSPGTTYHFRIVATNSSGTSFGIDETFTTLGGTPPWSIQTTPNPGKTLDDRLRGVSCVSESKCIAVGDANFDGLALDFNGSEWVDMESSAPGPLEAVSCTSSTACTAVGYYATEGGKTHTLVERWDGSEWKAQESPDPAGALSSEFSGVSCTSSTACTAVGSYEDSKNVRRTLASHWNGSEWEVKSSPSPGADDNFLNDVSCVSASACTAVGRHFANSLAIAWNGSEWKTQTMASGGTGLDGVSCTSASACTTVGNTAGQEKTWVARWNGSEWKSQTSPTPVGAVDVALWGVDCTSGSDCAAVGWSQNGGVFSTMAMLWNGSTWTLDTIPNPAESSSELRGVSCLSASVCEGVGASNISGGIYTLAERRE